MMNMDSTMLIALAGILFAAVEGGINRHDCTWQRARHGDTNSCYGGRVAIGACGAGKNADCSGSTFSSLYCCATTSGQCRRDKCWKHGGTYGQHVICPSGQIMVGNCGSGGGKDCYIDHLNYCTVITCCASDVVPTTSCHWVCGGYGVDKSCPNNYVAAGWCSSGQGYECNNGSASHCTYCCHTR